MTEQKIKIGVGPHSKPYPKSKKYDVDLLCNGDTRNVVDKYRYFTNDAIKKDLDKSRFSLQIAIENYQHDFNIGTIIRNANAFNVDTVYIVGKKHYNRRGAMVTDKYLNIIHYETVADFVSAIKKQNYQIIAVDNLTGAKPIHEVQLPEKCVLVFGGEGPGLSSGMCENSEKMVKIEQFGSTRSVNVGVASGIAMYVWLQQHAL